jgi:hypothetical protein
MKRVVMTLVLGAFVFVGSVVCAKDTVYYLEPGKKKEEKAEGKIENESPSGIQFKTDKKQEKVIPATQITQIEYGEGAEAVSAPAFRKPDGRLTAALKETKAEKKATMLGLALSDFRELDGNEKCSRSVPVHRYLQYRIAQIMYLQSQDDPSQRDRAIAALLEYKKNFADGWEIVPALQMLASLQQDKGDTEGAGQTFADLAELPGIAPAMKLQSQLRGARLLMRAEKFADAKTKLEQIESAMPADDPQRAFVRVYLLQARIAQKGKLDGIDANLTEIIRATKDGSLLALAHNSLGDFYRHKDDKEQAFWEYCKVDVLYNQDKEEHAKALYYLSQLYNRPRNDKERAKECLTRLKAPAFDGTLYQHLANAEKKSGE